LIRIEKEEGEGERDAMMNAEELRVEIGEVQ